MLIKIVSFLIEFLNCSKFIIPSLSTSKYVTLNPCFSSIWHVCNTAGCSILDVIICFPLFLFAYAIPFIAVLSLSEPHPVKYISFGLQLINFATFFLASSTFFFALLPILYKDDGYHIAH